MNYEEILQHYKKAQILNSNLSLLHWDMETYLPENSSSIRAEQLAVLSGLHHELLSDENFVKSTLSLKVEENSKQQKQIEKLRIQILKNQALSKELIQDISAIEASSMHSWKQARENKDFSLAQKNLERTVELQQRKAKSYQEHDGLNSYFGDKNIYEILLDDYEPGIESSQLRKVLNKLVHKTKDKFDEYLSKAPKETKKIPLPIQEQVRINKQIVKDLGFDFTKGRIDTSTHPFCGGNPEDIRMTTRYFEHDILEGLTGTIHETGHALYEQGLDLKEIYTPCGVACSMGTHESQSRFYENIIGRSRGFSEYLSTLIPAKPEEIFHAMNNIHKSEIRVESDEVTYNLHIALRMELEEKLILGELKVKDLPEAWNSLFLDYFGFEPSSDLTGCLQDVHWYAGLFGYFPTYSIGNLFAAELFSIFNVEIPNWENKVSKGEFQFIREFMNEKLHRHASYFNSPETMSIALNGKELDTDAFFEYLDRKLL